MVPKNPYHGSSLSKAVAASGGCFSAQDIDGTTASYAEAPPESELAAREETDAIAHELGGVMFNTLRATEMCMSETLLKVSPEINRLPPLCLKEGNRRIYAPIESLERFKFNHSPHAIHSVGVGIAVENDGAYHIDGVFEKKLHKDATRWRDRAFSLLPVLDPDESLGLTRDLPAIEFVENYHAGLADVTPLDYRIQLQHVGMDGEAWKAAVRKRLNELRMGKGPAAATARTVRLVDESNPRLGRYVLYMVPFNGTKEKALSHVAHQLCWVHDCHISALQLCIAGDTMTDLWAGLYGANGAPGIFALAGGSRLTDYLVGDKKGQRFAGEWLASVSRRLVANSRKGFYYIQLPCMVLPRVVVILDEAFPGTTDAQSVANFYKYIARQDLKGVVTPH